MMNLYTPVYKYIAISEIYIIYMYECKVDTHYTSPVVWSLLAIFLFICIYVFSGADKKDTGTEKA